MRQPNIGIVIPCYNDEPAHLKAAVASATQQTVPVAIVVVDDGSTDPQTRAALAQLPDGVRVIRQENAGPSAARNAGIKALETEYVQLLDADDWLSPGLVEAAAAVLAAGARIASADMRHFGSGGDSYQPVPERVTLADMVDTNLLGSASMFRRADWEQVGGFDEGLRGASEDYEFWVRLLARGGEARRVPDEIFHHRLREDSLGARLLADFRASRRVTRAAMARNTPEIAGPALDRVDDLLEEVRRLREDNAWWWRRFGFLRHGAQRARSMVRR